jgi:hypothetical protein
MLTYNTSTFNIHCDQPAETVRKGYVALSASPPVISFITGALLIMGSSVFAFL